MIRPLAVLTLIAAGSLAAPAARADAGKEVQGLIVVPGPGPSVQSTYPAPGATIPYGVLVLKVVFNQPMTPDAWAYGPSAGADFPDCLADPRLLGDQRTFVLLCSVQANRSYAVEINPAPRFASVGGRSAASYALKFQTTDEETVDLHDALSQAGLVDADDPIMTWRDDGKGVSQTAPPTP